MNLEFVTLLEQGEIRFRAGAKRLRNAFYIAADGVQITSESYIITLKDCSHIDNAFL